MTPAEVLAALKARITNREGGNVTRVPDDDLRTLIEIAEAAVALNLPDEPGGWQPEFGAKAALRAALARLGKGE